MRTTLPALLFGLGLVTTATLADFDGVANAAPAKLQAVAAAPAPPPGKGHFMGGHPLAAHPGAGFCYIDVPHTHDYMPDRPALYQQVGEAYVFTGDPVPFGYEGDKTVYYGHHPVPIAVEPSVVVAAPQAPMPTFCFMKGPHYHEYAPPEGPGYKQENNVVFYVGPVPQEVARTRPQVEQALEVEYRPYVAERPKVVVTPPPEWPGVVWVAPPAQAVVVAPAAVAPVIVAPPTPAIVVAPPVPTVLIAPPAPFIIGAPGPVIYMHGHGHGPHGPGKGHFKGKGHWRRW